MATVDIVFDISALLARLAGDNPTAPRITHYDPSGRIELSGRVLVNWAAKAANLLVEEFDTQPGEVVLIDLPTGHWRAVYWALASWTCGAHVVLTDRRWPEDGAVDPADLFLPTPAPDVVITAAPARWADSGAQCVAVEPAALARRFGGDVGTALDEAAVLSTYGDVGPEAAEPVADDPALSDLGYTLTYRELPTPHEGGRVLLPITEETVPLQVLALVLAVLAAGGSVVCLDEPGHARDDVDRLAATEQAVVASL